jgi:hypothetical protein
VTTEETTALTDLLLAVAALLGLAYLARAPRSFRRAIWLGALASFAGSAALGAAVHGLPLPPALRDAIWHPLYLLLGVTVALFVVGATADWRGDAAARRLLVPMHAAAVAFYALTVAAHGEFAVFVAYEAAALAFCVWVYLRPARTLSGAGRVAGGLVVSLLAGAVQADTSVRARLVWELDHNGLFHLVQLGALALLVPGIRRVLAAEAETAKPGGGGAAAGEPR